MILLGHILRKNEKFTNFFFSIFSIFYKNFLKLMINVYPKVIL